MAVAFGAEAAQEAVFFQAGEMGFDVAGGDADSGRQLRCCNDWVLLD